MKNLLIFFVFFSNILLTNISNGVLEKYKKNNVFVSTAFNNGLHVVKAMNANFTDVYCVELDKVMFDHSDKLLSAYFKKNGLSESVRNYSLYLGEPKKILPNFIYSIDQTITFLLCSHLPEIDYPEKENNVLNELEIIKNHSIKQHTIIVDYIHWVGTKSFGNITLQSITNKILEINPNYKFYFERGGHLEQEENAVLVAYIP